VVVVLGSVVVEVVVGGALVGGAGAWAGPSVVSVSVSVAGGGCDGGGGGGSLPTLGSRLGLGTLLGGRVGALVSDSLNTTTPDPSRAISAAIAARPNTSPGRPRRDRRAGSTVSGGAAASASYSSA
jgi:hypothetical protein